LSEELEKLEGIKLIKSGSFFVCGEEGTDIDFFALNTKKNVSLIEKLGYKTNQMEINKYGEVSDFISYRRGRFNIVLLPNKKTMDKVRVASHICKRLKVTKKIDRIAVFQAILYNNLT